LPEDNPRNIPNHHLWNARHVANLIMSRDTTTMHGEWGFWIMRTKVV